MALEKRPACKFSLDLNNFLSFKIESHGLGNFSAGFRARNRLTRPRNRTNGQRDGKIAQRYPGIALRKVQYQFVCADVEH